MMDDRKESDFSARSLLTNAFTIHGISEVTWKEFKGNVRSVSQCVQLLQESNQACYTCLGETDNPMNRQKTNKDPNSPARSSFHNESSIPHLSSLSKDVLHLYIFSWNTTQVQMQNLIMEPFTSNSTANGNMETSVTPTQPDIELVSSGEWKPSGGYSINEAPTTSNGTGAGSLLKNPVVASTSMPTVGQPGRPVASTPFFISRTSTLSTSQSKVWDNLKKLVFKSLEQLMAKKLSSEYYTKVGDYYVLNQQTEIIRDPLTDTPSNGLLAFKFKFFITNDENSTIGFYAKLVRTLLRPISAAGTRTDPVIVAVAPTGLVGCLVHPEDSISSDSPKQSHLSQEILDGQTRNLLKWNQLHHIYSESTVNVLLAGSILQFPRKAVFVITAPQFETASVATQSFVTQPSMDQISPLQLYHELYIQEFGSTSSIGMDQRSFSDTLEKWAPSAHADVLDNLSEDFKSLFATVQRRPVPQEPILSLDRTPKQAATLETIDEQHLSHLSSSMAQDTMVTPLSELPETEDNSTLPNDTMEIDVPLDQQMNQWLDEMAPKKHEPVKEQALVEGTSPPLQTVPPTPIADISMNANSIPLKNIEALVGDPSNPLNNLDDMEEDGFSETSSQSSHLSLSDEDDIIASRNWTNKVSHYMQSAMEICPSVYRPLNMTGDQQLSVNQTTLPPGINSKPKPSSQTDIKISDIAIAETADGGSDIESDSDEDDSEETLTFDSPILPSSTRQGLSGIPISTQATSFSGGSKRTTFFPTVDEVFAAFATDSSVKSSFSPQAFAASALARIASYCAGDSSQLCFTLLLYNFFEVRSGALLPNFVCMLYNAEVCFTASMSEALHNLPISVPPNPSSISSSIPFGMPNVGSSTRSDAVVALAQNSDYTLLELLEKEAQHVHSPKSSFIDLTTRRQSDGYVDIFLMYNRLDQIRLALWNSSFGTATTPGTSAVTPNSVISSDDIISSEWSSLSGTNFGPLSTEDWLLGRNIKKSAFSPKWSGDFECAGDHHFKFPSGSTIRVADNHHAMSQVTSDVFQPLGASSGISIQGPLTLSQHQSIIGKRKQSIDPFKTHSDSHEEDNVEHLVDPVAVVGYSEGSIELPPTSLYAWEKLNLRPFSPQKDIVYYAIVPAQHYEDAVSFFLQLSAVYEQCNLGTHRPDELLTSSHGVIACNFPTYPQEDWSRKSETKMDSQSSATTPGTTLNTAAGRENSAASPLPFSITEDIIKAYDECATKIAERLMSSRQYNISTVVYIVNPFTMEVIIPPFASDASSLVPSDMGGGLGATRHQQVVAQRSAMTLLRAVKEVLRLKTNVRNILTHGISCNRVTSPMIHFQHMKETSFNVFTKCRRVLLSDATQSTPDWEIPKLYEPLFVLSQPSTDVPSMIDLGSRDNSLGIFHVAYVTTGKTLTWAMSDCRGEILECSSIFTHSSLYLALNRLFEKVVGLLVDIDTKWTINFVKYGSMTPEEIAEWKQLFKELPKLQDAIYQVEKISLLSYSTPGYLDIIPPLYGWSGAAPAQSLNQSSSNVALLPDQKYILSQYGDIDTTQRTVEGLKTYALYNWHPPNDSWENPILASSTIFTHNSEWSQGSVWNTENLHMMTISIYQLFRATPSDSSRPTSLKVAFHEINDPTSEVTLIRSHMKAVSLHFHQLSWLNISPSGITRSSFLPIHIRLVQRLSTLHLTQTN